MRIKLLFFTSFTLLSFSLLFCEQVDVTIWVHGTKPQAFFKKEKSNYPTRNIWDNCPKGLHPMHTVSQDHQVRIIGEHLCKQPTFPSEHCYLFGWSGNLDNDERLEAGKHLFHELTSLVQSYRANGDEPIITLISHSHGGNVVLNMVTECPDGSDPVFYIDRTILLACPVQQETEQCVTHQLFKKVYSIHSHQDLIQVLDPQGFHPLAMCIKKAIDERSFKPLSPSLWKKQAGSPFFSKRHFAPHEKVTQVQVQWKDIIPWTPEDIAFFPEFSHLFSLFSPLLKKPHSLLHIEFLTPSFIKHLSVLLDKITLLESNDISSDKSIDYKAFL